MADVIPLVNDYDFSNLSDLDLDIAIDINQAILDQIDRMVAENNRQIDLEDDVAGRTRLIALLNKEKEFKTDEKTALLAEKASREGE